jgi:hypothetical protein
MITLAPTESKIVMKGVFGNSSRVSKRRRAVDN